MSEVISIIGVCSPRGGIQIFAIMMCLLLLIYIYNLAIWSSVPCLLMVEGMSVVVNVMLSLLSVMSVLLVQPIASEVMYIGSFCFRGELGCLNCDSICMCVVNKQFELLEFVFISVYVDLKYNEISLTFTAASVCLCVVIHVVVLGMSVTLSWYPMR